MCYDERMTMLNIPTLGWEKYVLSFSNFHDDRTTIDVHGESGSFGFGIDEVSAGTTWTDIRAAFIDREPVDTPSFTGAYDGEEFAGVLRIDGENYGEWGIEDFDIDFRLGSAELAVLREWITTGKDPRSASLAG